MREPLFIFHEVGPAHDRGEYHPRERVGLYRCRHRLLRGGIHLDEHLPDVREAMGREHQITHGVRSGFDGDESLTWMKEKSQFDDAIEE